MWIDCKILPNKEKKKIKKKKYTQLNALRVYMQTSSIIIQSRYLQTK